MPAPTPAPRESRADLRLDAHKITATVQTLRFRIDERFPGSGLSQLADDLIQISRAAQERVVSVTRPNIPLRVGAGAIIVIMVGGIITVIATAGLPTELADFGEFLQAADAALNNVVLIGASIFFLITFEGRIKRKRALRFLRELRALAHIVDMHQLTKDPERLGGDGGDTASSPTRTLSPFEMGRYLDYCSEMLSLISKIAALYIQNFDDPVVLAAVDEVEDLTTGLSRKIWQKIMILQKD